MSGKIIGFIREYVFGLSIIIMIIGLFVIFTGVLGIWFVDIANDLLNFPNGILEWCPYVLIFGLLIFGVGLYYLYGFIKNRNFVLEEILSLNSQGIYKTVTEKNISVCGYGPIMALVEYAKLISPDSKAKILRKGHSGEIMPSDEVVDYVSILFFI